MGKWRNIAFTVLFTAVCLSVVGYKAADILDVLPVALDNGEKSYLEGRELGKMPELSAGAFAEGIYQSSVERYCSDHFPARDSALLSNAQVQRLCIQTANILFRYEAYPTFFGSNYAVLREYDAIFEFPLISNEPEIENLSRTADGISVLSDLYKEKRFVVYVPDHARSSEVNPVLLHTNGSRGELERIKGRMDDSFGAGVALIEDGHEDMEDYLNCYFHTDHHWTIDGAYAGYCDIAEELDLGGLSKHEESVFEKYPTYGSFGRMGLAFIKPDIINDYDFDLPEYEISVNGEAADRSCKKQYEDGTINASLTEYDGYNRYFGAKYAEIIYTAEENSNCGNLLIVGDSFSSAIEPLLASSYHKTYVLDPRYSECDVKQYIEDNDIDDVVFIMWLGTLMGDNAASMVGRYSNIG